MAFDCRNLPPSTPQRIGVASSPSGGTWRWETSNQLSEPACQWVHDLFIAKWCSFLVVCLVCKKLPSQKLVSKFVRWIFDVAIAELPRSVFQYDVILCVCNILDLPTLKKNCLFRLLSNRFYTVTQKSGDWPRCIPVCIVCWLVFTHVRFVIELNRVVRFGYLSKKCHCK